MTPTHTTTYRRADRAVRAALLLIAALLTAATAVAQRAELSVDREPLYAGVPFTLIVDVYDAPDAERPVFEDAQGLTITPDGQQNHSSTTARRINGRMQQETNHRLRFFYRVTATRPGDVVFPGATISTGNGKQIRTDPARARIAAPEPHDDIAVSLDLDNTRAYVGQAIRLTARLTLKSRVEQLGFTLAGLPSENFETYPCTKAPPKGAETAQLSFLGEQNKGYLTRGRGESTLEINATIVPITPGEHTLGPLTAYAALRTSGDRFQTEQAVVVSEDAYTLRALPLPTEGKPTLFSGLVGAYTLQAEADTRDVRVGDPITLTVTLKGLTHIRAFDPPSLETIKGFTEKFRPAFDERPTRLANGDVSFTYTIRARDETPKSIPPVEIHYFNPVTEQYETARSEPIPLRVQPTRVITLDDARKPAPAAQANRRTDAGITHTYTAMQIIGAVDRGPSLAAGDRLFFLAPPLLFVGTLGLVGIRRRARHTAANPTPTKILRNARASILRRSTNPANAAEALRRCVAVLAPQTDSQAGPHTPAQCEAALRPVDAELAAAMGDALRACDASGFDPEQPGGGDAESPVGLARRAAERIPRTVHRKHRDAAQAMTTVVAGAMLCFWTGQALAAEPASHEALLLEATGAHDRATELVGSNPNGARAHYQHAIAAYRGAITVMRDAGAAPPSNLYHNLGAAYARSGQTGRAVASLLHALRVEPGNPSTVETLAAARAMAGLPQQTSRGSVRGRIADAWSSLPAWAQKAAVTAPWAVAWIALCGALMPRLRRASIAVTMVAAATTASAYAIATTTRAWAQRPVCVVVAPEGTVARKGPDADAYEPSFTDPLPEGTTGSAIEARGAWVRCELSEGSTAWIRQDAVLRVPEDTRTNP